MRAPSEGIREKDPNGTECACMAQILYMHNQLELTSLKAFTMLVGWHINQGDTKAVGLYYLLENGYRLHEISPYDPEQLILPGGEEYLATIWQQNGESPEAIKKELPKVFPIAKERAVYKRRAINDHPQQYSRSQRYATPNDIFELLQQGWQVICYIDKGDEVRQVLFTRIFERKRYEIFDPLGDECITLQYAGKLNFPAALTLQAYRKQ